MAELQVFAADSVPANAVYALCFLSVLEIHWLLFEQ